MPKDIPVFLSEHPSILHEIWTSFIHYGPILHYFVYTYMLFYYFCARIKKTPFTLTGFETFLLKHALQ